VQLDPGESRKVTVTTEPRAMEVWDEAAHKWTRPQGTYRMMVGGSSEQLPLTAAF
jgi:beta-glucosidase